MRFIPVATGNTESDARYAYKTAVHPRGYGEHFTNMNKPIKQSGSSPWLRGTLNFCISASIASRFIPVATGNTHAKSKLHFLLTVHPRGYGEHLMFIRLPFKLAGSSPWLRGTLGCVHCHGVKFRFIPVATGNTI